MGATDGPSVDLIPRRGALFMTAQTNQLGEWDSKWLFRTDTLRSMRCRKPKSLPILTFYHIWNISGDQDFSAVGVSSNPATERSPGSSSLRCCATHTTPDAISSLLATIAVGLFWRSRICLAATRPDSKVKSPSLVSSICTGIPAFLKAS
jgi:hypothetical protein